MQALTNKTFTPITWDRAGVAGSFVCITHCIATPFLAAAFPILAVNEKGTHIGLTVVLMLIGLLAFLPGYRNHSKPHMALVAAIGFAMLVSGGIHPGNVGERDAGNGADRRWGAAPHHRASEQCLLLSTLLRMCQTAV